MFHYIILQITLL